MPEISDITPSTQQASDRLLVRRGASAPYTLQLLDATPEPPSLLSVATGVLKGRTTAGTGPVEDLTPAQVTAMLALFSNVAKGLTPQSGGLATEVLRGNATWGEAPSNAEIVAARYAQSSLAQLLRVGLIGGTKHPVAPVAGRFYDSRHGNNSLSTTAGAANRIDIAPVLFAWDTTLDQIGVEVTTLIAAALGKIVIYSSNPANGRPDALLFESADLDFGSTGYKFVNPAISLQAGRMYWFGVRHSSTATLRAMPSGDMFNLGNATGNGTTSNSLLRRTLTFATGAPSTWGYSAAEAANAPMPLIRWRAA